MEISHPISFWQFAVFFAMAAIGVSETIYLIKKRRAAQAPICVIGSDCAKVLQSEYNKVLGAHNDVAGLLFYLSMTALGLLLALKIQPQIAWDYAIETLATGGAIMSLAMLFLQWRVIRAWCFWCVMSAVTVFVMTALIFLGDII